MVRVGQVRTLAVGRVGGSGNGVAGSGQRTVDGLTRFFGRPRFAGLLTLFILGWIAFNSLPPGGSRVAFDPWPFSVPGLTVRCEGRRLTGPFASESRLREAFANAPWETLELCLERG